MKPPKIQSNKEKALSIHEYLLNNLENPSLGNLQIISNRFYITPKTLTREFKKQFHLTVREFIKEERLKRAFELLAKEGKLVREVAPLVGFSDPGNFGRVFKKRFGKSPGVIKSKE